MEAAARVQAQSTGPTYVRRQPEKTTLYRVMQEHRLTFEQQWTDEASGRTLPKFVTDHVGETGAVTVIQSANSDLRLSPHFHTLVLDGSSPPT